VNDTIDHEPGRVQIGRAAANMGAVTAASRVIGLGRVVVIAAVLGTSALGDAFGSANSFSNVVFELLAAGALSAVLVPTLAGLVDGGDRVEADRLAAGILWLASLALGTLAVAGVLAAPLIARFLTAGVTGDGANDQRALVTSLLRWFIPQIVLYGFAAVATALLYARRHFAITSAAPIANTVIVVTLLVAFRALAGAEPTLALGTTERMLLGLAGTGGVIGFTSVLVVAARRAGFRVVPRRVSLRDPALTRLLRHSAWGVLLHSIAGLLLGAGVVFGASVSGGVVAYHSAFVLFLAPYAILAQPLHTAVLPELSTLGSAARAREWSDATRWTLASIAKLVLPVTALACALATPVLVAVRIGEIDTRGARLIAAALIGFGCGLLPYGAFLLFARASYSLGDSRTPALVAIGAGACGVLTMALGSAVSDGEARLAWLGAGHSAAYLVGAGVLGLRLGRRVARNLAPTDVLRALAAALVAGVVAYPIGRVADPASRGATLLWSAIAAAAGVLAYLAVMLLLGARIDLRPARR
jgi:putative peptidoglycan lipid II flippase